MPIQVITMSTKGQIVLPSDIREALSLDAGSKLAVFYEDGMIVLKPLTLPTLEELRASLAKAQEWATEVGYAEDDVTAIIQEARKG